VGELTALPRFDTLVPNMPESARRRVLDALAHRTPDRVPVDFGSSSITGMHVTVVAALRDWYGLEKRPVKVHEPHQMLGMVDDDLRDVLGVDVTAVPRRRTAYGFANENWKTWDFNGLEILVAGGFAVSTDSKGDTLIHPQGDRSAPPSGRMPAGGFFFDSIIRQNHFDESDLNPADNLEEYSLITDSDLDWLAAAVAEAEASGRARLASFSGTSFGDIAAIPGPSLRDPRGIRDIAEWYMSLSSRRPYVHEVFERQTEITLANLGRIHARIGNRVDAVYLCGTDFGTQTSSFCSVPTFRELWLPYYKAVNGWVHRHTTWKTFKHSCGAVEKFIPSLLEAGFDILNPVQCSAAGMDPEILKQKYGDRLVFWGGGVDTQKTLPFGTPAEVREQVLRRLEIFSPGGGFVFNTVHNIQAGTPTANIVAMVDAIREFNGDN
jgi:hypothetical protein